MSQCRHWYEGDPILEEYHDHEWCKENHDDRFAFEMLCLEGASTGLSWSCIMHKRDAYKKAFHNFDIDLCAEMSDEELNGLLNNEGIIRNRSKIEGKVIDGRWKDVKQMPVENEVSRRMSADMKKRGMSFVGPVITYSFLQAIGIVNDHLIDCEYR